MSYSNAVYFIDPDAGNDAARAAINIVSSTNATPIAVTATAHGQVTGAVVVISGHTVNTNAVGTWKITVIDANTVSLDTSVGNGVGGATGTVTPNGGASLADAWKTTGSGATAARTQPGDTIRFKASPYPTNTVVNGTWTDGPLSATQTIDSSTNATPIVVTKAAHSRVTGDTVLINSHAVNTNANGTWDITVVDANTFSLNGSVGNGVGASTGTFRLVNNCRVKLASALTANILNCSQPEGAWTASASVTATINTTDYKEGYGSSSIVVDAAFTTGLTAYKATGTLNLSGYKQVSFWIKQTAGTLGAAGATQLTLCSDIAGATVVNTINVPALVTLNRWTQVTVDLAVALGASIASVGFNVVTDNGTQTFLIDNIIACKDSTLADSLTLSSLISKNTGTETFHGIQSINGTRVMLDQETNTIPGSAPQRGYTGVTETVTTWKRECFKTALASGFNDVVNYFNESGSPGSKISYLGGYNRADMTSLAPGSQAFSWFDGVNGHGYGFSLTSGTSIGLKSIGATRYSTGVRLGNTASITDNIHCNNNSNIGMDIQYCHNSTLGTIVACNNKNQGVTISSNGSVISDLTTHNNGIRGAYFSDLYTTVANNLVKNGSAKNNGFYGIEFGTCNNNTIKNLTTSGNDTAGIVIGPGWNYLENSLILEATEVIYGSAYANGRLFSHNHDQTAGNHKIFCDGGLISSDSVVTNSAGISWKMSPTSANRNIDYPLNLRVALVAVGASTLVTAKLKVRRDNSGAAIQLMCKGGQIAGVINDVSAAAVGAIDTWEEVIITFTPTEAGVVELTAEAYGNGFNAWFDDLIITQA